MFLLKVIPIATKLPEKYFSYFSLAKIKAGSLVEIKIKNRKVSGIIVEVKDVKTEKMNLKGENFSLKKIESVLKENFIDENIINTLKEQSFLLVIKESDILENFLVDDLFEKIIASTSSATNSSNTSSGSVTSSLDGKSKAIIGDQKSRLEEYTKEIKKEFKKGNSSVIFSPTINDLKNLKERLEQESELKEILENNLIVFHGDQKKKEREENLNKLSEKGPKIFLSTPSIFPFLIKDKFNLNLVIIEKENSFNYFSHSAKKEIDAREIIKSFSRSIQINTILGGEILSLNTFKDVKEKKYKLIDLKEKSENKKILIFDLAKEKATSTGSVTKYSSVYFKKEVIEKLEDYRNKGEGKIFLYTKRKGIAGEIICKDCNHILKCESCDKPYILFKENVNGKREYVCAICKNKKELTKDENLSCAECGSWRMEGIGIGSEGIEENLKDNGFKVFVIDAKNTNTKTKIKKTLEDWQNEKLSVLVGTDLALNNINQNHKIDFAGIVSIDTLFSIPEINIDEKVMNLIIEFKEKCKTKSKIFIETRLKDAEIWKYVEENNYLGFLEGEFENRKMLNLPPFSNILKFRLGNKNIKYKDRIENLLLEIQKEEKVREEKINWKKDNKTGDYIGVIMINKKDWENLDINKEAEATNFTKKIITLLGDFNLEINPQNVYK